MCADQPIQTQDMGPAKADLDELVLYVCGRVGRPADLGAVKLQKVFWFTDASLYAQRRKPLTQARYFRGPHGPYSRDIESAITRLKKSGRLAENEGSGRSAARRQFFAISPASLANFSGEEISVLDAMIESIVSNFTAAQISEATHDRIWQIARPGERLPLSTIFVSEPNPPSGEDIEWANMAITPELLKWSEDQMRDDG